MIECPLCHRELADGTPECPHCGTPQSADWIRQPVGARTMVASNPRTATGFTRVVLVDVDMTFSQMVLFLVRWSIAAIPALLILVILGTCAAVVAGGVIGGVATGLH